MGAITFAGMLLLVPLEWWNTRQKIWAKLSFNEQNLRHVGRGWAMLTLLAIVSWFTFEWKDVSAIGGRMFDGTFDDWFILGVFVLIAGMGITRIHMGMKWLWDAPVMPGVAMWAVVRIVIPAALLWEGMLIEPYGAREPWPWLGWFIYMAIVIWWLTVGIVRLTVCLIVRRLRMQEVRAQLEAQSNRVQGDAQIEKAETVEQSMRSDPASGQVEVKTKRTTVEEISRRLRGE